MMLTKVTRWAVSPSTPFYYAVSTLAAMVLVPAAGTGVIAGTLTGSVAAAVALAIVAAAAIVVGTLTVRQVRG